MKFFCLVGGWLACIASACGGIQPALTLKPTEPLAAFTPDHPPGIEIMISEKPGWHGFIRIEQLDLLSGQTTIDYLSPKDAANGPSEVLKYAPRPPFGVYRLSCALVTRRGETPPAGATVQITFAFAPARDPHQLPDDWPLGSHVTFEDPPLPGFKWYRYFSLWAEDHPAKNQFDWSRLDVVVARIRKMGGRLLIANDTTPSWTAPDKPVTRPWVKKPSTAYPPDDMNDLRTYLDALLERFDDKAGTIGGLEVWNEANTPERWQGTAGQLVDMARIFRESAAESAQRVRRAAPAKIVGIAVSSGDAHAYVQGLVEAGILPYLDVVSGHWYEEILSYDRATPINSLPQHLDLVADPMRKAGFSLPIWNTESGIASALREDGKIISQDELNRRAALVPDFDPKQPWLISGGSEWRVIGERRAAAGFIAGTAMLMALGVEKTFVYSMRDHGWILDGAPSLSWVALGEFGEQLHGMDYHTVVPVKAQSRAGEPAVHVLAYRFGAADKPGVIVAWAYQQDTSIGRPKAWQPWLNPQPVLVSVSSRAVEVTDLYGRETQHLPVTDGKLEIPIGEEPIYLRELP